MRSIAKALLLVSVALPAGADTAFVVGNVDDAATTSYGAPRYLGTAFAPLDHAGFDLLTAIDADGETLRGLLSRLVSAEEDERLLIALSGRFVHFDGWTWFLGRDAGQPDLGTVSGAGLPLRLLMDYAAASRARTVILLAPEDQGVPLGAGLTDGIGPMEVPEGLTVAVGHPASVSRFLRSDLLQPGRALRDAFGFAAELSILAMNAPGAPFVPMPVVTPQVPPAEQSYWESMATLDNAYAYRAYLNRYPNGFYAAEARARIAALEPPEPQLTPQEAEQALGLSRDQRRDIQRGLAVLGYYNSGIDGIFGRGTRGGIESWQQANRLAVTGYLDAAQLTRLSDQADVRREEIRAQDLAYWNQTGRGRDAAGLRAYLGRYPNGTTRMPRGNGWRRSRRNRNARPTAPTGTRPGAGRTRPGCAPIWAAIRTASFRSLPGSGWTASWHSAKAKPGNLRGRATMSRVIALTSTTTPTAPTRRRRGSGWRSCSRWRRNPRRGGRRKAPTRSRLTGAT